MTLPPRSRGHPRPATRVAVTEQWSSSRAIEPRQADRARPSGHGTPQPSFGFFSSTATVPSASAVMPTASQPWFPSWLRAATDAEAPGARVGGSNAGRATMRYSHATMRPSWPLPGIVSAGRIGSSVSRSAPTGSLRWRSGTPCGTAASPARCPWGHENGVPTKCSAPRRGGRALRGTMTMIPWEGRLVLGQDADCPVAPRRLDASSENFHQGASCLLNKKLPSSLLAPAPRLPPDERHRDGVRVGRTPGRRPGVGPRRPIIR